MNTAHRWLLGLAALFLLALPAAALTPAPIEGVRVAATPTPSSDAYNPTKDEVRDQISRMRIARSPEQFACRSYETSLTPETTIPTANVNSIISFDRHTGGYEVVATDTRNRIIIGYKTIIERTAYNTFVIDQYNWSYAKGVKPYAVFVKQTDRDGIIYWGRTNPVTKNGVSTLGLDRDGDTTTVYIVATDTRTCAPGSVILPSSMWAHVARLH
ncbi:MAG TPA: hypothetical protein VJ841_01785 [Candidatus Saccharimonadales bacterium]|nr:hypothetical protein [Candidatus Saccharimonadales bacterium]